MLRTLGLFLACVMVAPIRCPDVDELRKLLTGGASTEEARRLGGHLMTCELCLEQLKKLGGHGIPKSPLACGPRALTCEEKGSKSNSADEQPKPSYAVPSAEDTPGPGAGPDNSTQHSFL